MNVTLSVTALKNIEDDLFSKVKVLHSMFTLLVCDRSYMVSN